MFGIVIYVLGYPDAQIEGREPHAWEDEAMEIVPERTIVL